MYFQRIAYTLTVAFVLLLASVTSTFAQSPKNNPNLIGTDSLIVSLEELKKAKAGDRVHIVDLSRYHTPDYKVLKTVPTIVYQMSILDTLNLSFNQITQLSREMMRWDELKTLDLRFNLLNDLPREVVKLKRLKNLYIAGNNIDESKIMFIVLRRPDLYIDVLDPEVMPQRGYLW
jgi:Leucine-rich repeat (LRR) protein